MEEDGKHDIPGVGHLVVVLPVVQHHLIHMLQCVVNTALLRVSGDNVW